jgi:hypothetical protein
LVAVREGAGEGAGEGERAGEGADGESGLWRVIR